MRNLLLVAACATFGRAESPTVVQERAKSAMEASAQKQRASILKQVTSVTGSSATVAESFFSAPWIEAPAGLTAGSAPCEPLAAPDLEKLIEQSATQEGVKADLIRAVINQESGGRPCAVSSKGAQGLMQLMPATSAQFGLGDPFEPRQNVEAGTKLLKQLIAKYKGDVALALSAYNAGETRVDREGGVPAIPETMQYVTSILARLPKK